MRFGRSRQSPKPPGQPVAKLPQRITPMSRVPMGGGGFNADQMQRIQSFKNMIFGVPMANKSMKKGGVVKSSASKRADGIAIRGKTRA